MRETAHMKIAQKKRLRMPALHLPPGWELIWRGDTAILQAQALAQFPWLVHGFSTRAGGASEQDGKRMLNLGFVEWDDRSRVERNRRAFTRALGASNMQLVALRQFHSSMVRILKRGNASEAKAFYFGSHLSELKLRPPKSGSQARHSSRAAEGLSEGPCRGDALASRAHELLLTVQTADCVPILLADGRKRVVAAIHAGWRGTAARIAEKAVGDLRMHFGTRPQDIWAAIGPAIGSCCYEVGPDVAHEFGSQFAQASQWFDGPFEPLSTGDEPTPFLWLQTDPPGHDRPKRARLDLAAANRSQLESAGVLGERIFSCGLCTYCQEKLLFSYRREGRWAGRMMSGIGIK